MRKSGGKFTAVNNNRDENPAQRHERGGTPPLLTTLGIKLRKNVSTPNKWAMLTRSIGPRIMYTDKPTPTEIAVFWTM